MVNHCKNHISYIIECLDCSRMRQKAIDISVKWEREHKKERNIIVRRADHKRKIRVLKLLGGKCSSCGTDDIRILTVNHINGDGWIERKEMKDKGETNFTKKLYFDIVAGRKDKENFDVKCFNCNILYEYERGKRSWNFFPIHLSDIKD